MAVVAVTPVFLFGAFSVRVRAELGFGPGVLGGLVCTFFVSSALASPVLGRVVQRLGSARGLVFSCSTSACVLLALALAQTPAVLFAAFVLGGFGNSAAQPAVSLALTEVVPARRLGLAFGLKQSSVPVASIVGGAGVAALGAVVSWRWAFAAAAVAAGCYAVALVRKPRPATIGFDTTAPPGLHFDTMPTRGLLLMAVGGMLAAAAATPVGAFVVESGVAAGLSTSTAGLVFAGASTVGLATRVGLGWYADTVLGRGMFRLLMGLLIGGTVGYLLLTVAAPAAFAVGAVIAYGAGWGWSGIFYFLVVTMNRSAPATATGIAQAGTSLGAGLGPVAFGIVAQEGSYAHAWTMSAVLAVMAAVVMAGAKFGTRSDARTRRGATDMRALRRRQTCPRYRRRSTS